MVGMVYRPCTLDCGSKGPGSIPGVHPKVQVMIKVSGARRFHWGVRLLALGPLDLFQYDHDMSGETSEAAFDRGVTAGEIAARLANHDLHFASINGHIGDLAAEIHGMRMDTQRLADQAEASSQTLLATAAALRDAEEARTGQSSQNWTPWARGFAVLAAMATVLSIVTMIIVLMA